MMDDTKLESDSENSTKIDSVNNTVNDKEPDDNIPLSKKNNWYIIAVIVIVIIIGGLSPFIIHNEAPNMISEITADGLLGYIVSFISAAVTAILAIYASYQTKQANEMTKRANDMADKTLQATIQATEAAKKANEIAEKANDMTEQANNRADELSKQANIIAENALIIERTNYQLQIRPFITVTKYDMIKYTQSDIFNSNDKLFIRIGNWDSISDVNGVTLSITNTTESFITFKYDDATSDLPDIKWENSNVGKNNIQNMVSTLAPGTSKEIVFIAENEFWKMHFGKTVKLSFILENRFTHKYRETLDMIFMIITEEKDNNIMNEGNPYYTFVTTEGCEIRRRNNVDIMNAYLFFQNYKLYRFEYNVGKEIEVKEEL